MKTQKVRRMTACAMIAALYAALSLALAPMSFGLFNFRISEALVMLPVFSPVAVWGVALGCLITNIAGVGMGLTLPPDILFGTLATLLGAISTCYLGKYRFKGLPLLSVLPPVLFNALIVGWEIPYFFLPESITMEAFLAAALSVGLGEIAACGVLGLLLITILEKTGLSRMFREL